MYTFTYHNINMNSITILKTNIFDRWFDEQNFDVQDKIKDRLKRVEEGNFGNHKSVGDGVFELKSKNPTYRIYYKQLGNVVIVLLCAGNKSTQRKDIKRAKEIAKEVQYGKNYLN